MSSKYVQMVLVGCLVTLQNVALAKCDIKPGLVDSAVAAGAPPEIRHWDKMIGCWYTTEESLKADGSGWEPSADAEWNFRHAYDGWGIIDSYTSPPLGESLDDERTRQRGVNLRIYNLQQSQWVMTWLTARSTVPATFTAKSTDQEIVMRAASVNPQGFHSRITFFEMTNNTFEWKLELSKDEETWSEVYRIHGKRK